VCGVSECDREAQIMRRLWSIRGCGVMGENFNFYTYISFSLLMTCIYTYIYIYIYIYISYRNANLQTLNFIYLFKKYTY
jgi:hypothetical protein